MMSIVFQNDSFVIIDKESGHLSVPSRFPEQDRRLVCGLELSKQLDRQVFPVHRLDCEVSGILLFALNAQAHSEANQIFEKHQVQKTYQALTSLKGGILPTPFEVLTWKAKVLRGKKRSYESPHGKISITEAQFLGPHDSPQSYRWSLKPITGRAHQLRFDLSRKGFPILGDELYGGQSIDQEDKIFLRARELHFSEASFCQKWKLPQKVSVEGLFVR